MKFSEHWLREWVNPGKTTEELAAEAPGETLPEDTTEAQEDLLLDTTGLDLLTDLDTTQVFDDQEMKTEGSNSKSPCDIVEASNAPSLAADIPPTCASADRIER